jgi:hypothetical protein
VLDAFESELVFEEVFHEPGKASGRERLASSVINPRAVIWVEPGVLMLVVIGAVNLVGSTNIHCSKGFALVIRAIIKDQRLVRPLSQWVGIDKAVCPCLLETRDQCCRLLQQDLHQGICESEHPVEHTGNFWRQLTVPDAIFPREQVSRG